MKDKTFIGDKQADVTVFELIDENTNFMGSIQFCGTCQWIISMFVPNCYFPTNNCGYMVKAQLVIGIQRQFLLLFSCIVDVTWLKVVDSYICGHAILELMQGAGQIYWELIPKSSFVLNIRGMSCYEIYILLRLVNSWKLFIYKILHIHYKWCHIWSWKDF